MAKENFVNFKRGQSGNLNSQNIENGTFWLTTDDQRLYIDIDDKRLAINAYDMDTKMDKANPTGTGSFSLNRKADTAVGDYSVAEGYNTTAGGEASHAEGYGTYANGNYSHAEGYSAKAFGNYSHAEGYDTTADETYSHAEGFETNAIGSASHAEGASTTASGAASHAEGHETNASSNYSHAEGWKTTASGDCSHAEGYNTEASGYFSHAEGDTTIASGDYSHAEGMVTIASGSHSHAEGYHTEASGDYSHAEGCGTIASSDCQHVQGKYNIEDENGVYAHIVGNGTSDTARSNVHTLDWSGNAWYKGAIKVGGTSYADANEVAIKADIAATAMQGTATQSRTYWKIHNFGDWGTGNWMQKGFSMLITSRAGEMVWVSLAADDSNTNASAIRLINKYDKIISLYYSVSESAIYVIAAAWANNICAHILSNVNGDYVPTIASASGLPSDAVEINIVEFGTNGTNTIVGDSSVPLKLGGSADRPTYNNNNIALSSDVDTKVSKSGDIMTGRLQFNMSNPHIHMKDTAYDTNWYFQAYQDQLAFGPTFATAVKTDKSGNMTVPGAVTASTFKGDSTAAAIRPSDSNEVNFGSNASYLYLGYENRVGSAGKVDTYKFGTHSGAAGATSGNIECGTVKIGSAKLSYNSSNECLDFAFV